MTPLKVADVLHVLCKKFEPLMVIELPIDAALGVALEITGKGAEKLTLLLELPSTVTTTEPEAHGTVATI